eukprot:365842-Chlamydomonas_euryale.AAC.1
MTNRVREGQCDDEASVAGQPMIDGQPGDRFKHVRVSQGARPAAPVAGGPARARCVRKGRGLIWRARPRRVGGEGMGSRLEGACKGWSSLLGGAPTRWLVPGGSRLEGDLVWFVPGGSRVEGDLEWLVPGGSRLKGDPVWSGGRGVGVWSWWDVGPLEPVGMWGRECGA